MRVLSYNLLKHKASKELELLADQHNPAAFCLQEINVAQAPKSIGDLELVIGTEKNRLGLAVYVNTKEFEPVAASSYKLKDATYDKLAKPAHERLLGVRVKHRKTGGEAVIGSFHASPLTALNAVRRSQIHDGLKHLDQLGDGAPLLMLGDYNYPVFRKRLEHEVSAAGYNLVFSDAHTYKSPIYRGHFDFMVAKDFKVDFLTTLKRGMSDHLPILAKLEIPSYGQ